MKKIKVGFFGGSFNPPINTHIDLANNLIKDKLLEKVIFVPVGDYYNKNGLVPAIHRYSMLKLACKDYGKLEVENIASENKSTLYAKDTFKLLYEKYNNDTDMYFIMGTDNFEKMPTWKNYDEMIKQYKYIVIERKNYEQKCELPNVTYYKCNNIEDITSTNIRKKINNNEIISTYINSDVLKYIYENKLYETK